MLKKIICLTLGLLMVLMALTSCSGGDDAITEITDEASSHTTTLNMWVIAGDEMDAAQASAVNAAINKITKSKFKTQLNIKFVSESEYYEKIEAAFAESEANGPYIPDTSEGGTILNEYGTPELKYPTAKDYQVDILFLGDYQKYCQYADSEWLVSLDSYLTGTSMKLNYYINSIFTTATKYNGQTYAIPNNHGIGEYTYLLANEEWISNNYAYNLGALSDFTIYDADFRSLLDKIYTDFSGNGGTEKVYPIYTADGKVDMSLVNYWSFDAATDGSSFVLRPEDFSLYGSPFNNSNVRGDRLDFSNLLSNETYMSHLANQTYYNNTSGYITDDAEADAAFRIVTGNWEDIAKYEAEGYKVVVMEAPRATEEEVFDSMFAVGSYSADKDRAMKIITYLNTNADFRNLLQYGIEGVNYTLENVHEGEGADYKTYTYVSPTADNGYHMDLEKTGNVFLAHAPNAQSVHAWEYAKKQNLDALTHPTLGLYFNLTSYKLDTAKLQAINTVSEALEDHLATLTTEAAVKQLLADAKAQQTADEMAAFLLSLTGDVGVDAGALAAALTYMETTGIQSGANVQSPNALYVLWGQTNKFAAF